MNRWRERVRLVAYAVAGVAFAAGALLALTGASDASVLAVSVGGGSLAVAVWSDFVRLGLHQETLSAQIAEVAQTTRDVGTAVGGLGTAVSGLGSVVDDQVTTLRTAREHLSKQTSALSEQLDRRNVGVHQRFDRVDSRLDQVPGLSVELARLVDRIRPEAAVLPFTGGWALGAGSLIAVVDAVLDSDDVRVVVECGSGASTVWTAAALRTLGSGHVYALEHDGHFAAQTRDQLAAHGLQDWATIIDAPLGTVSVEGESVPWFDLAAVAALPDSIDLLLVDGPPGAIGPLARRPAYPVLRDRLRVGALVVLDDTDRAEEQAVAAAWLEDRPGTDRHLVERNVVGRTTFYRVEDGSKA